MPRWLAVLALAGACGEAGTSPGPEPAHRWPEGTVLAVGSRAIPAAEVEATADAVQELYPQYARIHCRRLALTNLVLPRAAVAVVHPSEWARAREACAAALVDGGEPQSPPQRLEGSWRRLGFDVWCAIRNLEPGSWSPPQELVGRFARLRVVERPDPPDPEGRWLVEALEFPVLPPSAAGGNGGGWKAALERTVNAAHLEIVEASWRETVPETWKHRMKGDAP